MQEQRIGQVLGQMGKLSPLDIDEILAEQRATHARFGTLAVSLGFCEPEHVWAAWCSQLSDKLDLVDLDDIGIDAQAASHLPREIALSLKAIPIRVWQGHLVVAVSDPSRASQVAQLGPRIGVDVKIVLASAQQIEAALRRYYPVVEIAG